MLDSEGLKIKEYKYWGVFLNENQTRNALHKAFKADWFNYAFLGNGTRHQRLS